MPAPLIPALTSSLLCPTPSIFPTLATTNEHLNVNSSAGEQQSKFPATLSTGLAIGVVLGPVFFFLLIFAFMRVSQGRDLLPQWVTESFRIQEEERRTIIQNWIARLARGAGVGTSHTLQTFSGIHDGDTNESGSESPTLPQYTPPAPLPPSYQPPSYQSSIFSTAASTPPGAVE